MGSASTLLSRFYHCPTYRTIIWSDFSNVELKASSMEVVTTPRLMRYSPIHEFIQTH